MSYNIKDYLYIINRLLENQFWRFGKNLLKRRISRKTGAMDSLNYSIGVLKKHFGEFDAKNENIQNKCIVELGPGRSLGVGMLLIILGASKVYELDATKMAFDNEIILAQIVDFFLQSSLQHYIIDREQLLKIKSTGLDYFQDKLIYHAPYNFDAWPIPSSSVDFVFSHAVLEHVSNLHSTYLEMNRVLKMGGKISHIVDLRDHFRKRFLGNWARFLQYPDGLWNLMTCYYPARTNRFRCCNHLTMLKDSGFEILSIDKRIETELPIEANTIAARFASMAEEELKISDIHYVAQKVKNLK